MKRALSILDLPVKIRERICEYAELTGHTHDLNYSALSLYPLNEYPRSDYVEEISCFHGVRSKISRQEDYHTLEVYWELPYDLDGLDHYFFCEDSRCEMAGSDSCSSYFHNTATHPELCRIMIGKNHVRICQGSPGGFKPFLDLANHVLTRDMLTFLGTLTVRLDGEPPETINVGGDWMRLDDLVPFNLRSRYGKAAIKEWEELATCLARAILPSRLILYIVAKAQDVETAKAILKPLNNLPTLKGCGIYLNKKPIPELIDLAKSTVERLSTPISNGPVESFRYLDLPLELRYRILEFSDLVSEVDLEWKPSLASVSPIQFTCACYNILNKPLGLIGHLDGCTPTAKEINVTDLRRYYHAWDGPDGDLKAYPPGHCCVKDICAPDCRRDTHGFCACHFQCKHAAYTNTVTSRFRVGPHPLFLVSHQVRQDAIPIFFQQNRFVITPPGIIPTRFAPRSLSGIYQTYKMPMWRTELSMFLSIVPTDALQNIRYLEWTVPRFSNYTLASKSLWLDYIDTVELMAHAMHLPKLTLVLNLRALDRIGHDEGGDLLWPKRSHHDGVLYDSILRPLCLLEGIKDCFVYLKRISTTSNYGQRHGDCVFDDDEMMYEKAIMGLKYDSNKRGKPWMERFEKMQMGYFDPCDGRYQSFVDS